MFEVVRKLVAGEVETDRSLLVGTISFDDVNTSDGVEVEGTVVDCS